MEKETFSEHKMIIENDSLFDQNIKEMNDNFKNKSPKNESKDQKKRITDDNFDTKFFEDSDLNEIYDILNEMNKAVTIDIKKINKKSYYNKNKKLSNSDHNINIISDDHSKECQEILSILNKPLSNKNIRNKNKFETPFKPLLKPKKISLVGKIIFGAPSNDNNTECSTKDNNIC